MVALSFAFALVELLSEVSIKIYQNCLETDSCKNLASGSIRSSSTEGMIVPLLLASVIIRSKSASLSGLTFISVSVFRLFGSSGSSSTTFPFFLPLTELLGFGFSYVFCFAIFSGRYPFLII